MRIVVLGYMVRGPLGGMAWHHLQYTAGFAALGHDVFFLEDSDDFESCYDPRANAMTRDPAFGLAFATEAFARVGLGERWAYYDAHTARWLGPAGRRALDVCLSAEVAVNVSRTNRLREWHGRIPRRVLIDTDPVFTQIEHLTNAASREQSILHTHHFSFAENIGRGARVPDDGFDWLPTRQPIVLDAWDVTPGRPNARCTTVMQWDSYAAREYAGVSYGMKSRSFEPYLDLPKRTRVPLGVAVGAPDEVLQKLRTCRWVTANPLEVASDPSAYQAYIRNSRAEFTVAKHGYVVSDSGWFSERSAAYLASGRPVVTQDTGFTAWLPAGEGLIAFGTPDDALEGLHALDRDYAAHCKAARALVEEHFDARKVLQSLLDRLG